VWQQASFVRRAESIPTQRVRVEILGVPGIDEADLQGRNRLLVDMGGTRCFLRGKMAASEGGAGVMRT
jgi:hypothetical protein